MRRLRWSPSTWDRRANASVLSPLESVRSHQRIGCLPRKSICELKPSSTPNWPSPAGRTSGGGGGGLVGPIHLPRLGIVGVLVLRGGVQQQFRPAVKVDPAHDRPLHGIGRQLGLAGIGGPHGGRPVERGHLAAGLEPAQDHLPHRLQGILGGIAGGDELAELGGRDQQVAAGMVEENRIRLHVVQAIDRPVETGHLRHDQVGLGGLDFHEVAVVNRQELHFLERRAEDVGSHDDPLQPRPPRGSHPHFGKPGGVFDVQPEFLLRRLLDDGWLDRRGLLRIAVGQDQHARRLGRCLDGLGGRRVSG